jgi:predicted ATPase
MGDLCVLVGNNGSGKSSLIEALQCLQEMLFMGLGPAFERWGGLEQVRNNRADGQTISFRLVCEVPDVMDKRHRYEYHISVGLSKNGDKYRIEAESLKMDGELILDTYWQEDRRIARSFQFTLTLGDQQPEPMGYLVPADEPALRGNFLPVSLSSQPFQAFILRWQFLNLEPRLMGQPMLQSRTGREVHLKPEGENLAEYFLELGQAPQAVEAVLDRMKYILPELSDIQSRAVTAIARQVMLEMREIGSSPMSPIPGWLMSSGTLRALALLVLFQSPNPPSIIFIEEIENGLDPRTLNLMVEEIRNVLDTTQVVVTTHSPYFLDLVDLKHIVVADRREGETRFYRPDSDKRLDAWKKEFSPGRLYTMNKLDMP